MHSYFYAFSFLFFILQTSTTNGTIAIIAMSAAKKMFALGKNDCVPSLLVIISAFFNTAAPIAGPIIPGISTCEKMRKP